MTPVRIFSWEESMRNLLALFSAVALAAVGEFAEEPTKPPGLRLQPKAGVKLNPLAAVVAKSGGEFSDLVLAPN